MFRGVLYLTWLAPGFAVSNALGLISNSTWPRSLDTWASLSWVDTAALPLVTGELSLQIPKGLNKTGQGAWASHNGQGHGFHSKTRPRRPEERWRGAGRSRDRKRMAMLRGGLHGACGEQRCSEHPCSYEGALKGPEKPCWLWCCLSHKQRVLMLPKWGFLKPVRSDQDTHLL